MPRRFNTAGPCRPDWHYMLPPEGRLPQARRLIDEGQYFVLHAPRQTGKTTLFRGLAEQLNQEGEYLTVYASCERGQAAGGELEAGVQALLRSLELQSQSLPPALRPRPVDDFEGIEATGRLRHWLTAWCLDAARPVVLFLDEIDALRDDSLLSVLRQLREGYTFRPEQFPHSVVLIGLRDVRDYKTGTHPRTDAGGETLGTASPFNIKSDSISLRNFTAAEISELYGQHSAETGQVFTPEALDQAFELTGGQPWLVNALARQLVEEIVPDRSSPIGLDPLELAKEILIRRRDTHLDSLVDRLREPRVRRVLEPILTGEPPGEDVFDGDVHFVQDLGLVTQGDSGLTIANAIYQEIIPRALTATTEAYIPVQGRAYVGPGGRLLWDRLLDGFLDFWRANAEWMIRREKSYPEAAAQLVLMAFLHRIFNGPTEASAETRRIASIDREFAVGSGRVDLLVRWPLESGEAQRFAVEIKVRRDKDADPLEAGLRQLGGYLGRLGLEEGTLVLVDQRRGAPGIEHRCSRQELEHEGRRIDVLRL